MSAIALIGESTVVHKTKRQLVPIHTHRNRTSLILASEIAARSGIFSAMTCTDLRNIIVHSLLKIFHFQVHEHGGFFVADPFDVFREHEDLFA